MTKVLYVEHNDDNLYMLKTRLELRGGFEVLAAEDSEKGCRLAATARSSASKRLSETRSLRVLLGAEPAVRVLQRAVAATAFKMIDAPIARDLGAHRELALDGAARWHLGIVREQLVAGVGLV